MQHHSLCFPYAFLFFFQFLFWGCVRAMCCWILTTNVPRYADLYRFLLLCLNMDKEVGEERWCWQLPSQICSSTSNFCFDFCFWGSIHGGTSSEEEGTRGEEGDRDRIWVGCFAFCFSCIFPFFFCFFRCFLFACVRGHESHDRSPGITASTGQG